MGVKQYSLQKDGEKKVSSNFIVKEFANSQTDKVLICDETVEALQKIRDYYGKAVNVSSGFRLPENGTSQHNKGRAADFRIAGMNPRDIIRYIEPHLNPPGLGLYDYDEKTAGKTGFVHIDYRTGSRARWIQTTPNDSTYRSLSGKDITVAYLGDSPSSDNSAITGDSALLREGSRGEAVSRLQNALGIKADGIFGPITKEALIRWQNANGLTANGIADEAILKLLRIM